MAFRFQAILCVLIAEIYLSNSNLYCADSQCKTCLEGYNYKNISCLSICPTGFQLVSNSSCILNSSTILFSSNFYTATSFAATSIFNFTHPLSIPFNDSRKLTPVPTKSQGLLFRNTSGLIFKSNLTLAPDFCFSIHIKVLSDGIIFKACKDLINFIVLRMIDSFYILEVNLTQKNIPTIVSFNSSIKGYTWFSLRFILNQNLDNVTIQSNIVSKSFIGLEFRVSLTDLDFILGSFNNDSFFGFIYTIEMTNDKT